MRRQRAFYACNVFHYHHVVAAMRSAGLDVTLATRFELSPAHFDQMRHLPLPAVALEMARRRVVERPADLRVVGLGPGSLIMPLTARVNLMPEPIAMRRSVDWQGRWVTPRVGEVDLFQFSEGLGHRVLERGFGGVSICERRHLHHAALESDPGSVGDFPYRDRPDPIGDFLDVEYAAADRIAVYSNVARDSFLERGFDARKVVITPLGLPPLDHGGVVPPREAHRVAFVGRGDAFKGLDIAVAAVKAMGSPYRLEVAGACTAEVKDWLARQPHVDFLGILGRTELRDLYRRSQVLLNPSIESFGYAALEGASHGARLVCSPMTGAREFLPKGSHRVVAGRDPLVWAAACLEASTDPVDTSREVRAALESLTWSASAERLVDLYSALTNNS